MDTMVKMLSGIALGVPGLSPSFMYSRPDSCKYCGNEQMTTQAIGSLHPQGIPLLHPRLLASAEPSPGLCVQLGK